MPAFTVYNAVTGEVRCTGTMATEAHCLAQAGPGEQIYLGDTPRDHFILDGVPAPMGARPSEAHVFDWGTHSWTDPRTLADLKAAAFADLAEQRWIVETGGLTLPGGLRVKTDRPSREALNSLVADLRTSGAGSIDFKAASGWVTVTRQEAEAIARAVAQHVQACFSTERRHHEAIDALESAPAVQGYDFRTGWGG